MCRMGGGGESHFHSSINYHNNEVARSLEFSDFGGSRFSQVGIKKWEDFYFIKFNQCVNSFHDDLVKRLYKVDA